MGDRNYRSNLEEQVEKRNIKGQVIFYGQQSDVSRFLEQTDIFVYPSVCQEVFGISIVEAMAYGIPCIANNVGGIPEVIDDGVNGFLTRECTSEEIANQIEKVIELYKTGKEYEVSCNAQKKANNFSVCYSCSQIEKEAANLLR